MVCGLYRKWDFPVSFTDNLIFFGIAGKLGLHWEGLETHSEKGLGAGLSGPRASDNVVWMVLIRHRANT